MQNWEIRELHLPLKFNWKISRNESLTKTNFLVTLFENQIVGMGEIAFNVRYGESADRIVEEFAWFKSELVKRGPLSRENSDWLYLNDQISSSFKMGICQALTHLNCQLSNKSIDQYLNLKSPDFLKTSFSIPIIRPSELNDFLKINNLRNYPSLKLKIKGDESFELLKTLLEIYDGKVRIDANEGFKSASEVTKFFKSLGPEFIKRIEFVEQPLPVSLNSEMVNLKDSLNLIFIADESITNESDIKNLSVFFDGVNIKLMKSGSLKNAMRQIAAAKEHGMKILIGCMIETSLSLRFAYALAAGAEFLDLDGFLLIKNDPFDFLQEKNGLISLKKEF